MKTLPSIERLFEVYMATQFEGDADPMTEEEARRSFFCGFRACLEVVDALAEITATDEDAGEKAWQLLQAECERFATEVDCGAVVINH